jgi:hypothetical protein
VGAGAKAAAARRAIMRTFELQNRMTLNELLAGAKSVTEASLIQKYCAVASQCGEAKAGGRSEDEDAAATVRAVVRRVMEEYDKDGNGKLSIEELQPALSSTDGRLSLGALDPGAGGVFSPANLWNGFIACLCLFFVFTIVDQIAAARQVGFSFHFPAAPPIFTPSQARVSPPTSSRCPPALDTPLAAHGFVDQIAAARQVGISFEFPACPSLPSSFTPSQIRVSPPTSPRCPPALGTPLAPHAFVDQIAAARQVSVIHPLPTPIDPFHNSAVAPALEARALKIKRVISRKQSKSAGARRFRKGSMSVPLPPGNGLPHRKAGTPPLHTVGLSTYFGARFDPLGNIM